MIAVKKDKMHGQEYLESLESTSRRESSNFELLQCLLAVQEEMPFTPYTLWHELSSAFSPNVKVLSRNLLRTGRIGWEV